MVVRVGFCKGWRTRQIDWQFPRGTLDRSLHVGCGVGDAFAEHELQRQRRVALRAIAGDDVQTGDLQELLLQRRRDVVGHRRGVCAGIRAGNLNNRIIHCGQIVDGKFSVSRETGDNHGQRQQNGHHGPANKRPGESRAFDWN